MSLPPNWKTKYHLKHSAQKVLGAIPGLYHLQELVKSASGHWDRAIDDAFIELRFRENVERFNRCGIRPPRRVAEQGSGWHGCDLVFFALAGAESIETWDVRPWLKMDLLARVMRKAPQLAQTVCEWDGVDPVTAERRARELVNALGGSRHELLSALGATTHVSTRLDLPGKSTNGLDLFYSNSVLQRMVPVDLATHVKSSLEALEPGAVAFHTIDCKDFHAIEDPRIPELFYLTYPEANWEVMTSRYLNYQNRLRLPDFEAVFKDCGFSVDIPWREVSDTNREFFENFLKGRGRYETMNHEDASTSRFEVVATRPLEDSVRAEEAQVMESEAALTAA